MIILEAISVTIILEAISVMENEMASDRKRDQCGLSSNIFAIEENINHFYAYRTDIPYS